MLVLRSVRTLLTGSSKGYIGRILRSTVGFVMALGTRSLDILVMIEAIHRLRFDIIPRHHLRRTLIFKASFTIFGVRGSAFWFESSRSIWDPSMQLHGFLRTLTYRKRQIFGPPKLFREIRTWLLLIFVVLRYLRKRGHNRSRSNNHEVIPRGLIVYAYHIICITDQSSQVF